MKITENTEPFPGVPPHFWGVMSDEDKLPDFTPDCADDVFGLTLVLLLSVLPAAEA